ncbi:MAG: replication/repair protein RecF [Actinomycetota bacterium]|jgi:DNA replication and repair protein RecF
MASPTDPPVIVRHVSLADVRNYESLEVGLAPGINALVGPNGQGKTNLVEAVAYLSTLGSHRVATDAPLIRHGAERAIIRADVVREDRSLLLEIEITPGKANRARINRAPVAKTREILGILRTVVFAPEDLALVKGDPSERRRFLDDLLVQRQPRLAGTRSDYDRVLKQRNALLKSSGAARRSNIDEVVRTLEVWDDQLAQLGAEIITARRELTSALAPLATAAYQALVPGSDSIAMRYRSKIDDVDAGDTASALLAEMDRRRKEELDRGITLVGPHRDDVDVSLGSTPVKGYASHGESWSAALALRLAAYDLLTSESGAPVLVLDDVFAELDSRRRAHLAERVADAPQVLITAAVADDVPAAMSGAWYDVLEGTVTRRD